MKKISVVFGTRPEAIKLAPVILELKKYPDEFEVNVCVTAQHREMLDQVLEIFGIVPDHDLNLMKANQSLAEITSSIISKMDNYFKSTRPDLVLVQGDTTTVMAASIAAFYNKVKIGHVEAGLRTWNKYSPFPEEMNRVITGKLADIHFAPTEISKQNLIKDGIDENKIFVTGNTVIDALLYAIKKLEGKYIEIPGISEEIFNSDKDIILITGHRRENFGEGFKSLCMAILELANLYPEILFIYPVHLNPNISETVYNMLGNNDNIILTEPLSYLPFISLMNRAKIILTDSGGVQEEAPSLGKPVLVMRENTERPEAVTAGTVKLVGTDKENIINSVKILMTNSDEYEKMVNKVNPYGNGNSAKIICDLLSNKL